MKFLKQLVIILAVSFVGEILHEFLPIPIPASIYGIVLMFVGLMTGVIPLKSVRETSLFLVDIMPVMFIAPAVGVIDIFDQVQGKFFLYLFIVIVSTIIVMGVSGSVTQLLDRLWKR